MSHEDLLDTRENDRPTHPVMRRSPVRLPRASHFILTSVLARVWVLGLAVSLYSVGVLYARSRFDLDPGLSLEASLTFAVGMMLSIRVTKSYDRWWEARTQWGKLVNVSRKLATKLRLFAEPDVFERREIHRVVQGFPRALKNHLRGGGPLQDIRGFSHDTESPVHVPVYLAGCIYSMVQKWRAEGRLTDMQTLLIDREASDLLEVAGACERIQGTPMPPSFRAFVGFSIAALLLSLPWWLVDEIGWMVVPALTIATFLTAGGESIAHRMERPFGLYYDDLDLESYCNGIDQVTAEILGVPARSK